MDICLLLFSGWGLVNWASFHRLKKYCMALVLGNLYITKSDFLIFPTILVTNKISEYF